MNHASTSNGLHLPKTPLTPVHSWARESPRRRFSSPYNLRENLDWIANILCGPTRRNSGLTQYVSQHLALNSVAPQITLTMIGDVMPALGKSFEFADSLRAFLQGSDYLVLNLEGVISQDRYVWNGFRHTDEIVSVLGSLFPPERTIMALANNHAADCGWVEFDACYQKLKRIGFSTIGRRDEPSIVLHDAIEISCGTDWSNQRCEYISWLDRLERQPPRAPFRILYPHWGYELHLFPNAAQIARSRQLLTNWDMVVGHHSHCPQPITHEGYQLIAYSLGNFMFGVADRRFHHGIILRTTIGQSTDGRWRAGTVDWRFTHQQPAANGRFIIHAESNPPLGIPAIL